MWMRWNEDCPYYVSAINYTVEYSPMTLEIHLAFGKPPDRLFPVIYFFTSDKYLIFLIIMQLIMF